MLIEFECANIESYPALASAFGAFSYGRIITAGIYAGTTRMNTFLTKLAGPFVLKTSKMRLMRASRGSS